MISRRVWAAAALVLAIGAVVLAIVAFVTNFPTGLTVLACLVLAVTVAWLSCPVTAMCRSRWKRSSAARVLGPHAPSSGPL